MGAGNVSSRINHHHQRGTNCQGRNDPGSANYDRTANRENEEEGANEFYKVFVHSCNSGSRAVSVALEAVIINCCWGGLKSIQH